MTWFDVDFLDFSTPRTAGSTIGARDGNAAANQTAISGTIIGLNIPAGEAFFIRFTDFNPAGSDDGLAIDDFSLIANPNVGPRRRRRRLPAQERSRSTT